MVNELDDFPDTNFVYLRDETAPRNRQVADNLTST
jgi:hypothetical protein